jgi:hypothetical protein
MLQGFELEQESRRDAERSGFKGDDWRFTDVGRDALVCGFDVGT